jgi:predicted nucleic acid-binding protein
LSTLVRAELAFGIAVAKTAQERAIRQQRLAWIESLGWEWQPFDVAASDGFATLAAQVHKVRPGHSRSKDIMLAGHAYSLGASLATLNSKDFEAVQDLVEIIIPKTS